MLSIGQGSGDFAETSGRIQPFHVGLRNSVGILAPDGFTQGNPPTVTTSNTVSTTLAGVTSVGVLGCSVAFTRPDAGNGFVGGPPAGAANVLVLPLGIFINDAIGNPFENTPGVASGRAPYYSGFGCYGLSVWETQNLNGGAALTYSAGNKLFASRNGFLTNLNNQDNCYECDAQNADSVGTLIGVVKIAPDAENSLMVIDLRI